MLKKKMFLFVFARAFIALVLLSVIIVSFSFGIIGLNEMCEASNPATCPFNPPQKLVTSFIVSGVFCFSAIVVSIIGLIGCCENSVTNDYDDILVYDEEVYCFHGGIFIGITALFAVIVILMTIIYSAMPRPFDRATLIFFLVVTHLVGGFSISWAFIPVGCRPRGTSSCCTRIRSIAEERRKTQRINAETRKAQAEALRLERQIQLNNQQQQQLPQGLPIYDKPPPPPVQYEVPVIL